MTKTRKQAIAIYVPKWLYQYDVGITIFVKGLFQSIKKSGRYRLIKLSPRKCRFKTREEAQAFATKHDIALVIYHGSRVIPKDRACEQGLDYLESCVPFLNPREVHIADDKFETKRILKNLGIPVLPDFSIKNRAELVATTNEGALYVAKPHNAESGNGVKLIKRNSDTFFEYHDGSWERIRVRDTKKGIILAGTLGRHAGILIGIFAIGLVFLFLDIFHAATYLILCLSDIAFLFHFQKKISRNFRYNPLMLEPFFGDDMNEFYCLRCTVIGNEVVEAAKKSNKKNVTPNISHGGKASKTVLSDEQRTMAVTATKAMGATYAGIDLLVSNGKTVLCEVNVGPIGVYCEQTEVDVGKILGEYAMQYCDQKKAAGTIF